MRRGNIKYITVLFLFLLAVIYIIQNRNLPERQYGTKTGVPVIRVHDGDTISVIRHAKKEKVRLVGIDAPEIGQTPWGKRAKKYLETLVDASDRRVRLEFDVSQRDKYGRSLAYVWTGHGKMINLLMVQSGHAVLYTIPPNVRYTHELREAQKKARDMRLGIWGEKGLKEMPSDYRKRHPRT
jgi:micrococcal nuclease